MNKKQYSIMGADMKVLGRGTSHVRTWRGGRYTWYSCVCVRDSIVDVVGCSVVFGALVVVCIVIASI